MLIAVFRELFRGLQTLSPYSDERKRQTVLRIKEGVKLHHYRYPKQVRPRTGYTSQDFGCTG